MKYLLIVSLYCFVNLCYSQSDGPIIKTDLGLIKGIKQFAAGIEINSYLGIPYGLPPVGARRFEKTFGLRQNFTDVFHADKFGAICNQNITDAVENNQPGFTMSEDCLTLNVWTPKDAPGQTLYPVLISLYGSDFTFGSSSDPKMRSDYLTAFTNIVSVNMNYRLGALGFAYDGTDQFIGNQAVIDFLLATNWIYSNIRAFGGDPDRITVSGFSAGAIMLSALFMTPTIPTNWFNRLVFFDGAVVEHVTSLSTLDTIKLTKKVSNEVNCSEYSTSDKTLSTDEIVCLKTASAKAIANAPSNKDYELIYGDKYILPIRPSELINSRKFPKGYTMLFGTEANEAIEAHHFSGNPKTVSEAIYQLSELLQKTNLTSFEDATKLTRRYFEGIGETDLPQIKKRVVAFLSNYLFQCPSLLHSVAYAKDGDNTVYTYRNNYITRYALSQGRPFGSYHGDGHDLFFGLPYRLNELHSDKDRETSLFMMNVLGDFIKGKNPFWSSIKVTGYQPDQISLDRWNIKNNATITNVDYDKDKEICLIWAKYYQLNI